MYTDADGRAVLEGTVYNIDLVYTLRAMEEEFEELEEEASVQDT